MSDEAIKTLRALVAALHYDPSDGGAYYLSPSQALVDAKALLEKHPPPPKPRTWRDEPATEKQKDALFRFGLMSWQWPETRGEASDMLDGFIAHARKQSADRAEAERIGVHDDDPGDQPRDWGDL